MAAPPARARADYDYLIKLLLIGDSGMLLPAIDTSIFRFKIFVYGVLNVLLLGVHALSRVFAFKKFVYARICYL